MKLLLGLSFLTAGACVWAGFDVAPTLVGVGLGMVIAWAVWGE